MFESIPNAPYIQQAEREEEPEDTLKIGECHYCGKPIYPSPVDICDEYIKDEVLGFVCRNCFGTKYFNELKTE